MTSNYTQQVKLLKNDFLKKYSGQSKIQEILPNDPVSNLITDNFHLSQLHQFVKNNPIYYKSIQMKINDISCTVYEGNLDRYWLSSIENTSSKAPFSPTWLLSAYIISQIAKKLGYLEIVDIGSGDGRIAYCAEMNNLKSISIEIDSQLSQLQNSIINKTNSTITIMNNDATKCDFGQLELRHPLFCIGGLSQMGGNYLGTEILQQLSQSKKSFKKFGFLFPGTNSKKYPSDPLGNGGWGTLIRKFELNISTEVTLPTMWTFHEIDDTPYFFVSKNE